MSIVELIGFVISFIALLLLFFKNRHEAAHRRLEPEAFEEDEASLEGEPLKQFLKTLESEFEIDSGSFSRKNIPPVSNAVKVSKAPKALPKPHLLGPSSPKPQAPFASHQKQVQQDFIEKKTPRIVKLLHHLPNKRSLIIAREIIDKPKGWG